ncbi:MAG: HAMP domain-containing histidine kinase [Bdellovibrionales bacterium]|nr:HAMP domain-containing histidine kinase [Oligoflexia bacterium]
MKPFSWTPELEARYQETSRIRTAESAKLACMLALILFPAFSLTDWFTQREHFLVLSEIRYSAVIFFVVFYFGANRTKLWSIAARSSLLLIFIVATLSITLMTLVTGSEESPYYAGVNLVSLAAVLVLPWGAIEIAWTSLLLFLIYVTGVVVHSHFRILNPAAFMNNLSFMLGTGIIGTSSAFLSDRLRRGSFERSLQIERSVNILSKEQKSSSRDLETLSLEVHQHKVQLEQATRFAQTAQAEAVEALNVRDEFISVSSHELKTPLTILKLQNDYLRMNIDRLNFNEEQSVFLRLQTHRNENQIYRLTRLIDDMLDLSQINANSLKFVFADMDLSLLLFEMLKKLHQPLSDAKVEVETQITDLLVGNWDRLRLEQVLMNLLTNTAKHAQGSKLTVRAYRENHEVVVELQDTGPGIPSERVHQIFEQFTRANSDIGIAGLGLGLFISKRIIESHRGSISAKSTLGKGSIFSFRLPRDILWQPSDGI